MNRSRITGDLTASGLLYANIANDRVGIGLTTPTEKLDVNGTIQCLNELRSTTGNDLLLNAGSVNRDVKIQVNDVNMLYVKGDTGNIGINETSPQQLLHVHNDTAYQGILINGNNAPRIAFARTTTTTGEWSVGIDGTNGNQFAINNSNDNSNRKVIISSSQISLLSNTSVTGDFDIADKIIHTGDTDTAIRFPSANTVSIETGGQQNVQVDGTRVLLKSPSGTNTTVRLQHQGNSGYGDIILDRTVNAFIIDNDPSNASSNQSYFSVKNKGTENLRIISTGFVGINTNNPARRLHVEDGNSELALFKSTKSTGSYINFKLGANGAELGMIGSGAEILSGGADAGDFGVRSAGDLCISSGGHAEKLRITSGGKVNIGGDYTQTSYQLSVTDTGGNLFRIKTANEGDYDLRFMIQNSESNIWHYGTDDFVFGNRYDRKLHFVTNAQKRLTIHGDHVGINQTAPLVDLDIKATAPEIRLTCSDNNLDQGDTIGQIGWYTTDPTTPGGAGTVSYINTFSANGNGADYSTKIFNRDGSGGGSTFIQLGNALGSIKFGTNTAGNAGIERVRIKSDGIVTIGPAAQDIQIIPHSSGSGHGQIYMRGNASGESSSIKLNHYGHADYVIGSGRHSNGMFSITRSDTGVDGLLMNTSGKVSIGKVPETLTGNGFNAKFQVNTGASNDYDGILIGGGYNRSTITTGATYDLVLTSNAYPSNATSNGIRFKCGTSGGGGPHERMRITADGKVGINYSATPPSEDLMVRGLGSTGAITIQHLSGGNTYGARVITRGSTNTGFKIATQFNSSYSDKIEMNGNGQVVISLSGDTNQSTAWPLNLTQSGNYNGTYPGLCIKSSSSGGGSGFSIVAFDSNWGLYTNSGNRSGISILQGTSASSSNAKFTLGEDGVTTIGKDAYNYTHTSRYGGAALHVAKGSLSIGGNGGSSNAYRGGVYQLGWYITVHANASYYHLKTDLWAGGSPHGNTQYIMGGFRIEGYSYSSPTGSATVHVQFHNWSGSYPGLSIKSHYAGWNMNATVYTSSDGYVVLRVAGGTYKAHVIDLIQHIHYPSRDINVTSTASNNNATHF